MTVRPPRSRVARALAATAAVLALPALAQPLAMSSSGELRWVCGGVGADERRALTAFEPDANVKLLFVTAKRGGYLAGATLSVIDGRATSPRLQVAADGPICLLRLPPGPYRLEAGFEERTRTARVRAEATGLTRVVFTFPDEPWDGIRASDEEKAQARAP